MLTGAAPQKARPALGGAEGVISLFTQMTDWAMRHVVVPDGFAPDGDPGGIISRMLHGDLQLDSMARHLLLKIPSFVIGKFSQSLACAIVAKIPPKGSLARHVMSTTIKTALYFAGKTHTLLHGSDPGSCGSDGFEIEAEQVVKRLADDVHDAFVSRDGHQPSLSGRQQAVKLDLLEGSGSVPTDSPSTSNRRLSPREPQAWPFPVENRRAIAFMLLILICRIAFSLLYVDGLNDIPELADEALWCLARLRALRAHSIP